MPVNLTISRALGAVTGVDAAIADSLVGGSSGLDLGQVLNNEYVPIINKAANTGYEDIYVAHDAVVDEIDEVKTYIAQYTGTYGGPNSPAADIATVIAHGAADNEATANNSDGLSAGFRIEHAGREIGSLGANAFLPSRAQVNIYGNSSTDGIDLASAFDLHVDALIFNNSGSEVDATTPQTGKIGKSGDSVLGDVSHVGVRYYLLDAEDEGGLLQFNWVWAYSYTA